MVARTSTCEYTCTVTIDGIVFRSAWRASSLCAEWTPHYGTPLNNGNVCIHVPNKSDRDPQFMCLILEMQRVTSSSSDYLWTTRGMTSLSVTSSQEIAFGFFCSGSDFQQKNCHLLILISIYAYFLSL